MDVRPPQVAVCVISLASRKSLKSQLAKIGSIRIKYKGKLFLVYWFIHATFFNNEFHSYVHYFKWLNRNKTRRFFYILKRFFYIFFYRVTFNKSLWKYELVFLIRPHTSSSFSLEQVRYLARLSSHETKNMGINVTRESVKFKMK